jgi:hypothetical protein
MPVFTSGGSIVTSANIVDNEIVNADIATGAAIAQSKIAASTGANTELISFEQTVGVTHSLTTVAGQRVIVIIKGDTDSTAAQGTVIAQYNAVTKDTVRVGDSAGTLQKCPFSLVYSEVPGAATQNITVTSGLSLANVVISVIKLRSV